MATVVERRRRDGAKAFQAQIVVKRQGKIVHRESRTFERRQMALAWGETREAELATAGAIERLKADVVTLGMAIQRFIDEAEEDLGRTKTQVLKTILANSIASLGVAQVTSREIVSFLQTIDAMPQTRQTYLSHMSTIFTIARPAWGYDLDRAQFDDAIVVARKLGLVAKAGKRDRRPTLEELDRLFTHMFATKVAYPQTIPMAHIVAFAIFSTRRQGEITRILWDDLDEDHARILVRDMKHPGEKIGNHTYVDLVPEAMRVLKMMPRIKPEIFPYNEQSISSNFTNACSSIGIENLHFHDLRHEGISRLFEIGWHIAQAATVSGHRTWDSLRRYTHIRMKGDKYRGWPWLDRLETLPIKGLSFRPNRPRRIPKRKREQ